MKKLLARLDDALANCRDPEQQIVLQAQRACHLARVGRFDECKQIVAAARSMCGRSPQGFGLLWIMLAEGLLHFFESYDDKAQDRLLRVKLLCETFGISGLRQLSSVWLAHIEFNRSRYGEVAHLLTQLADDAIEQSLESPTFARVCLLVADIAAYSGEEALAAVAYGRARQCAVAQGDDATTAAILYNKPAMALFQMRLQALLGAVDPEKLRFLAIEMGAAQTYHFGSKHGEQNQLLYASQARLHLLSGEFVQASEIFSQIVAREDVVYGFVSDRLLLLIEYALALVMSGDVAKAKNQFERLNLSEADALMADDQWIFWVAYRDVAAQVDAEIDLPAIGVRIAQARSKLESEQAQLRLPVQLLARSIGVVA